MIVSETRNCQPICRLRLPQAVLSIAIATFFVVGCGERKGEDAKTGGGMSPSDDSGLDALTGSPLPAHIRREPWRSWVEPRKMMEDTDALDVLKKMSGYVFPEETKVLHSVTFEYAGETGYVITVNTDPEIAIEAFWTAYKKSKEQMGVRQDTTGYIGGQFERGFLHAPLEAHDWGGKADGITYERVIEFAIVPAPPAFMLGARVDPSDGDFSFAYSPEVDDD